MTGGEGVVRNKGHVCMSLCAVVQLCKETACKLVNQRNKRLGNLQYWVRCDGRGAGGQE